MILSGSVQRLIKEQVYLKLIVCLALLFGLGGCGYKSPPLPPKQVVPKPITDLRYELSEKGATLHWSYPQKTMNGTSLSEIAAFDLYRAVVPLGSYCESCPIPFGEPVSVPGGVLPPDGSRGGSYVSSLLRPGHLFFFKVRSKTGWWAESEDSNIVSFVWFVPPAAPENLKVQAGDSKIALSWGQVSKQMDGSTIAGEVRYRVFRAQSGGGFKPLGDLLKSRTYVDKGVVNGKKYIYKVQALVAHEKGAVGGGAVSSLEVSSVDKTAPAPPTGVKAVKTAAGLKVFWNPVKEKDIKAYRIYRRVPGVEGAVFVGKVNVPYTLFVDQEAPLDAVRIYYSVSSIDGATPANESAASPEAMIRND